MPPGGTLYLIQNPSFVFRAELAPLRLGPPDQAN